MKTSRIFDLIFLAIVAGILTFVLLNRVAIQDWLFLQTYEPSTEVRKIATDSSMTELARNLWYRGDPMLETKEQLSSDCGENSIGCTSEKGRIYVLAPGKGESYPDVVVTGAHEMLHMAYRRLTKKKKAEVDGLLSVYLDTHPQAKIVTELAAKSDSARMDEANSRLGTEIADLGAELEVYYQTYFTDRRVVVGNYAKGLRLQSN